MLRSYLFIVIFIALFFIPLHANKAVHWWTFYNTLGDYKNIEFYFRQEYRFTQSNYKLIDARFSLCSKKKLTSWLNGETHYALINFRTAETSRFLKTHRFEFEINPHFEITKNLEMKLRNRFELLKPEHQSSWVKKFRQRQQLIYKIDKNYLKSISCHNEIFYSFTTNQVEEFRIVPLELEFKTHCGPPLSLYAMLRELKSASSWTQELVLGATFNW